MIDKSGNVIYVGKAKNIKKRILQYLKPTNNRTLKMLSFVHNVQFLTVKNEVEALVVEAKLVRSLQPKYNILLKDDKSYPYIAISCNHDFPRISKYRGKMQKNCYGPFISKADLKQAMIAIQKAFKIRSCSDTFFASRKKPCMEYQIKRCHAPCVGKISSGEYKSCVNLAKSFLSGKAATLCRQLKENMQDASKNQQYEIAGIYRDRLFALQNISTVNFDDSEEADYIGIHQNKNSFCIDVISFRKNNGFGNYRYFLENLENESKQKALSIFLLQYWVKSFCKTIYTNAELDLNDKSALELLIGHKIKITLPKQGIKAKMIDWAISNAKLALQKKIDTEYDTAHGLQGICNAFNLPDIPQRVEVYDNSHISGEYAVGVMIVVGQKGFEKNEYRCFNINQTSEPDDYAMMQEVLRRRFKNNKLQLPDFVLIDGGFGHLGVVKELIPKNVNFACIAKSKQRNAGNETFFLPSGQSIKIEKKDLLYFLQKIRDEAHRFAIKSHRNLRKKSASKSALDNIIGIGPVKKKLLLQKFGSVDGIKRATVAELTAVPGINANIAGQIKRCLGNY